MAAGDVGPAARKLDAEHELSSLRVEADLSAGEPAVAVVTAVAVAFERETLVAPAAASMRTNVEAGPSEDWSEHRRGCLYRHPGRKVGCQCRTASECRERDSGQQDFFHRVSPCWFGNTSEPYNAPQPLWLSQICNGRFKSDSSKPMILRGI
jgi:hypothetical protein